MKKLATLFKDETGATAIEYALIAAGIGLHLYREDRKDRAMAAWKVFTLLPLIDKPGEEIQQKWQTDWDRMFLQPTPHKFVR